MRISQTQKNSECSPGNFREIIRWCTLTLGALSAKDRTRADSLRQEIAVEKYESWKVRVIIEHCLKITELNAIRCTMANIDLIRVLQTLY